MNHLQDAKLVLDNDSFITRDGSEKMRANVPEAIIESKAMNDLQRAKYTAVVALDRTRTYCAWYISPSSRTYQV